MFYLRCVLSCLPTPEAVKVNGKGDYLGHAVLSFAFKREF